MSYPDEESALVRKLSDVQREKLRYNRHKDHWRHYSPKQMLRRAETELRELRRAIEADKPAPDVWAEAADVANFVAMVAQNHQNAREDSR